MPIRVQVTDSNTSVVSEHYLLDAVEMVARDGRYSINNEGTQRAAGWAGTPTALDALDAFGHFDSAHTRPSNPLP